MRRSSTFAVLTRFTFWLFMVTQRVWETEKTLRLKFWLYENLSSVRTLTLSEKTQSLLLFYFHHSVLVYCWTSTIWHRGCINVWTVQVQWHVVVEQILLIERRRQMSGDGSDYVQLHQRRCRIQEKRIRPQDRALRNTIRNRSRTGLWVVDGDSLSSVW